MGRHGAHPPHRLFDFSKRKAAEDGQDCLSSQFFVVKIARLQHDMARIRSAAVAPRREAPSGNFPVTSATRRSVQRWNRARVGCTRMPARPPGTAVPSPLAVPRRRGPALEFVRA
jgi:hypothetical protein